MLFKSILLATALVLSSSANAAPIAYQGNITSGNIVIGELIDAYGYYTENPDGRDWWTFSGSAGDIVDITGGRLDADLDLSFSLYSGTTSVDENLFVFDADFGGMTFLGVYDDEWGPNVPGGPFQDPQLLNYVLPTTGIYSIAMMSAANDPLCGTCSYELVLNLTPVPVPAAVWLFCSGLIGLIGVARKKSRV